MQLGTSCFLDNFKNKLHSFEKFYKYFAKLNKSCTAAFSDLPYLFACRMHVTAAGTGKLTGKVCFDFRSFSECFIN